MLKQLLSIGLVTCALSLQAQDAVTLVSWTFQTGYDQTTGENNYTIFTPNSEAATNYTGWSSSSPLPYILPTTTVGDAANYTITPFSNNRYWQLCDGNNVRVLRLSNDTEAIDENTAWDDATQHKVYYEVNFPTKGYKDISMTFAIAPGNNAQTPVEIVVSTDNGQTWFDAGNVDTSATWFTYEDRTVNLSVNNKDNVRVRLLPTAGQTNWNLRNISISGLEMEQAASVDNKDVTFTWEMGSLTPNHTATPSDAAAFSVYEMTIGTGLKVSKTASISGEGAGNQTLFKPSNNNSGSMTAKDAIVWTVTPKKGITFKPTSFAFQASKHGTGGGKLGLEIRQGDKVIKEAYQLGDYARNNNGNGINFTSFNEAISGAEASSEPVTVTLYVYNLADSKEVGFANIVVSGVANGEVEPVPVYTLSLKSAVEGAGAISCAPAGAEFDEGTPLTVSATENFGYHFQSWTDESGKEVSTENPYQFEITGNTQLTANYTKNNVYAINLTIDGGANINQVLYQPAGNIVDGVHYYEEGTEVMLTTVDNRIISFNNWEDNTTTSTRIVKMDGDKDITATFSAVDYIVGWDFYFDQPNSERAADYKAESDNAGLLSLHNADGKTTSWLTRGVGNGAEEGKWGARIWKLRSEGYYFEASFRSEGYSNLKVCVSLGCSYSTYNKFTGEYSTDGENYTPFAEYEVARGWKSYETELPTAVDNQKIVKIRFIPVADSGMNNGNATDYDGLCISDLYILADRDSANDDIAPELVNSIPADNSTDASATGSIILTFNEKITLKNNTATLNGETVTGKESGKSAIYSYTGLDYATDYTFTVAAGAITDRNGNPFAGTSLTFTTLERQQPEARLFDVIVAKDGSGDFTTVQEAINAAPENAVKPYLIFVKNGNYKEHVNIPANKPFLHFTGQDRDKTVILDDKLCGGDNALHVSVGATVVVNSNDCFFENITLENSYGHEKQDGPQALALNTTGDRTIFNNVAMLSYQDTWITPSTSNYRAYVRNSFIEGAVDFIYNSGNIYIDNTTLYINRKSGGYIVAPSHGADVEWGYVFNNCTITAPGVPSETSVWLGRPWHNQPKTVFLNTRAEVTIPTAGWYETMGGLPALWADWNTVDVNGNVVDLSQRRDTYYIAGSKDDKGNEIVSERVYGKAKNYLTDDEAAQYTVKNVLSGSDSWQPVIKTESCAAPVAKIENNIISWDAVPYAICYLITRGDEVIDIVKENTYTLPATASTLASREAAAPYTIQAVNEFGGLSEKGEAKIATGIDEISVAEGETVTGIYDVRGMRHNTLVPGVNIVKKIDADGVIHVEKVVVR